MDEIRYPFDCAGDVVAGDEVIFTEAVFGGLWRRSVFRGTRTIAARLLRESYGAAKQCKWRRENPSREAAG